MCFSRLSTIEVNGILPPLSTFVIKDRLAALSFCHILNIPSHSTSQPALFTAQATHMSNIIGNTNLDWLCDLSPGLTLWILLIGVQITISASGEGSLKAALVRRLRDADFASLKEAESQLAWFFYLNCIFRDTLRSAHIASLGQS
jgi:hypothetical protein